MANNKKGQRGTVSWGSKDDDRGQWWSDSETGNFGWSSGLDKQGQAYGHFKRDNSTKPTDKIVSGDTKNLPNWVKDVQSYADSLFPKQKDN
jgi:hypothetical protein